MWISYLNLIVIIAAAALTIFAALSDIRTLIIPNWTCLVIALLYPLAAITSPNEIDWIYSLVVGGIVFAIGFGLFAAGLFGGGDVKLIAALSFWAGANNILNFLFFVALAGGVLVIVLLIREASRQPDDIGSFRRKMKAAMRSKMPIPYGVAIALGSFAIYLQYIRNSNVLG